MAATPASCGAFREPKAAAVDVQEIGRLIVRDEEVDVSVVVDVGGDHPHAPPSPLEESRRFGDVGEMALVITEDLVGARFEFPGIAADDHLVGRKGVADPRILGIPDHVVADVQVEVAVVIEVGESGRCRPIAVARQARRPRHILESPVPSIAIQAIGSPPGQKEVGMAVVVVIADGDAVSISLGHSADSRGVRHIFECPVAAVAKQPVSPWRLSGIGGNRPPCTRKTSSQPSWS